MDFDWVIDELFFECWFGGIWEVMMLLFQFGVCYVIWVGGLYGLGNIFNLEILLFDLYVWGFVQGDGYEEWCLVVIVDGFDWGDLCKFCVLLDRMVIYEGYFKGFMKWYFDVLFVLYGMYVGFVYFVMIEYFYLLGVIFIELFFIQVFVLEFCLFECGFINYWGYNIFNFFILYMVYVMEDVWKEGLEVVLFEFKGMVWLLYEVGFEVIFDVVYNYILEEGIGGLCLSLCGIDNVKYYCQDVFGVYIDMIGCGNMLNMVMVVGVCFVFDFF